MMPRRLLLWLVALGAGAALGWILFAGLPRWLARDAPTAPAATAGTPETEAESKIKATVFHGSDDGMRLVAVEQDVAFESSPAAQAQRVVEALLQPPPAPLLSVIPAGTKLRAVYLTDGGEAFVDFTSEIVTGHPGGSLNELYTVYTIVNSLTTTLPAVTAVQILVDGREVETLAGHVDLRHPLQKNPRWVSGPAETETVAAPAGPGAPLNR
jgi:spore germination protein GerM